MAVLARLKIAPNQRLDLPDIVAFDSYSAGDWKGFMQAMVGTKPYLIRGFEVFQPNTLIGNPAGSVDITILDSMLWWSQGGAGSFFTSLPAADNKSITLITDATNYIELALTLKSTAEDARALWDPGANGGLGGEFTQVVDTENYLDVEITRNNTGFSEDKIPLAKILVNSSNNVVSITDCRPMMFRLGTGGNVPDPLNDYIWPDEPVGFSRTDTPTTMTSPLDPNVFKGADKNIKSFKEWMDAVMSRLKEIDGGSKWFQATGGGGGGTGGALSLTNLFLDSQAGHSPTPDRRVSLAWSKANDGIFRSENAPAYSSPVRWAANFGQLQWQLGGAFVSSSNRAYSNYLFDVAVADGESVYLALQRDAALNGDPIVHFENLSGITGYVNSFSAGAFTGIACGDYVRKESNNVYQYYRVAEIRVNAGTPFTNGTVEGTVADATVGYLLIETHDGPIATTDEPYRFFRKSYQNADLITSDVGSLDTSNYWLGRRVGTMFYLRDYGDMQPGEETEVLNDHDGILGGSNDIVLERANGSIYDPTLGYSLLGGGVTTLLTIRRRLADNTVGVPSPADNSGSLLTFTVNAPIGVLTAGQSLWARLGTTSGSLVAGDVTDVTTDNVYEIRSSANAPLRSYDNNNVYLVARKLTVDGTEVLLFNDGVMLNAQGQWFNNNISISGTIGLPDLTPNSILFIGADNTISENNAEFFWDNTGGLDSLGELGVRNIRFGEDTVNLFDYIDQDVQQDFRFLPNIGPFTIQMGGSSSTIYIPGDLIVIGTTTSISTSILQVDDKVITLGVGNILNAGFGSGIEVADDTRIAQSIATVNGQIYVSITYAAPHGYVLGDEVGVASNTAVGGITAGQMGGTFTVVSSGAAAGDAEVISTTVLRIWTAGTATSTQNLVLNPPTTNVRTYLAPWSIRLGAADGTYGGITSWIFRVKGVATAPAITPVLNADVVPTAISANFTAGRIPFAGNDNAGPLGSDTTLDFSAALLWDGTNLTVGGGIMPLADNTYDIGSTSLRWKTIHVGPGSFVVHGDAVNTLLVQLRYAGSTGILDTDATSGLQLTSGANNGIKISTLGHVSVGAAAASATSLLLASSVYTDASLNTGIEIGGTVTGVNPATHTGLLVDNVGVSGATVTNQYGIQVADLTSGTNNFAIETAVSAGLGKWNLYIDGTATNYIAGGVGFGNNTQASINNQRILIGTAGDTTAAGGILFGGGLSNLYRAAADTLRTDGNFIVGGTINITGSLRYNYGTVRTADYAITVLDNVVPVDTTAAIADVTVTLPVSDATNKGQLVIVKDVGGACNLLNKAINIAPNGADTIDTSNATIPMTIPFFALSFVSNGAGSWILI